MKPILRNPLTTAASWIALATLPLMGCEVAPVEDDAADAAIDDDLFTKASACDDRCSPACQCQEGEGDCDRDDDCAGSLVCEPDGPGKEVCVRPAGGSCKGRCSASCPCQEGEGDCDRDADCAGSLVCPPDRAGTEYCERAGSSGGGSSGGGSSGGGSSGDGSSGGGSSGGGITHVGTTEVYDSDGQNLSISRPSGSRVGDLLVLILHRTDDVLPLNVRGWNRAAACFKHDNGYDCVDASDCTDWYDSSFCRRFGGSNTGRDLAQTVLYKAVGASEPSTYRFNLNRDSSGHPGWAILTALRGANTSNPVRDWAHKGCDGSADSVFPSVRGQAGDMLLLSQSFDDTVSQSKFGAPSGMQTFGYVSRSDEAGYLFGAVLRSTGATGSRKTSGDGASSCKDGLVSLAIRPQ